uniref:UBL3-like ubiquitin domain-containing protein n=1 Tax=Chromera velia CCMP2878 TaxID=1169474 RepID=A0A0G4HJ62_9ALVE|mmetsp:Transcript_49695/g.97933  ORF Transcript_49695/g.97933 Transcript_49695/m.97933 type:complete len:117 (+) Transcript_49695:317-667(+)|eukprot:Cvel_1075.t1-p1 / transcript=Cvel_1075.t1 / gene=Cvel_1075 / organism=Chromera_velia_CCMP2878 / gene_product=hypothetical protein / transcript_product=hypothetical protein / location=Cvel_scaffold35:27734-29828(+) / protein_length=116 / sequence_SO=supercontig / SO=protein_coding / is_pseudo=false
MLTLRFHFYGREATAEREYEKTQTVAHVKKDLLQNWPLESPQRVSACRILCNGREPEGSERVEALQSQHGNDTGGGDGKEADPVVVQVMFSEGRSTAMPDVDSASRTIRCDCCVIC